VPGGRTNRVYRIDVRTGETIGPTGVRNFSAGRYYNRVALGTDPHALEEAFGRFESLMSAALDKVEASDALPSSDELGHIVGAMVVQSIRTPLHEHLALDSIRELREQSRSGISDTGDDAEATLAWAHRMSFINPTREALAARPWTLMVAPEQGPHLICPDPPPYLLYRDELAVGSISSPDAARSDVVIVLPVTRRHMLVSNMRLSTGLAVMDAEEVAFYNMMAFYWAREYVYSDTANPKMADWGMVIADRSGIHVPRRNPG